MSWQTLTLIAAAALFLFDFQNMLAWSRRRTLSGSWRRDHDYTLVVPLYGDPRYFEGRRQLLRYQPNVLVAIDVSTPTMRSFADELEVEGWRVHRAVVARPSPPALIRSALADVTTGFVLRMDADTTPLEDVGRFIAAMSADGADLASVKVRVADPRNHVHRFQDLEYQMAMLSRHFRPWLTSGACFAARTEALALILEHHSLWFPGEDIETGRIAHALKLRVRHLDMTVQTDAPASWRSLLAQRRTWWAGSFRHSIINFDRNAVHLPVWTFYYVLLVWVGVAFKWDTLLEHLHPLALLQTLAWLFVVYAFVTVIANWQVRSWRMLFFPPYALLQAVLMPTIGSVYYWRLAHKQGYLGRYRFGYRRGRPAEVAT